MAFGKSAAKRKFHGTLRVVSVHQLSEDELVAALLVELTAARWRGLDYLDLDTHQYKPVKTPYLEELARRYANDWTSSRIALIRDLLRDALVAWRRQKYTKEAKFVRNLFFTKGGDTPGKYSTTDLLDAVKDASGLNKDAFDERRRAMFRLFARFLIRFVAEQTASSAPAEEQLGDRVDEDDQPAQGHDRAARFRRLVIAGVVIAAVAIGVIIWIATRGRESTAVFTFDDLGGGSPIIQVYPGVTDKPEDKMANGSFEDGQTTTALCKTTGRMVHSVPADGELDEQSDVWVKVLGRSGMTHYATLVYGNMPPDVLASLPECSGR
jgi:hypothetical protein